MGGCINCSKCYEQSDGTIVKRSEEGGKFVYETPDQVISETMPTGFVSTKRVGCEKFDQATSLPVPAQVLEVVDVDGNQVDNQLVRLVDFPDGSTKWRDLKTGTDYDTESLYLAAVGHAGGTTHTSEDTDYNEQTVVLCDEGTDVIRTVIYRDGDITDVVSTTITNLAGAAHTLSGNERSGSCSGLVKTDQENACFVEVNASGVAVADKPKVGGYVRYSTNAAVSPSVTTSEYFGTDDVALVKAATGAAGFKRVECC